MIAPIGDFPGYLTNTKPNIELPIREEKSVSLLHYFITPVPACDSKWNSIGYTYKHFRSTIERFDYTHANALSLANHIFHGARRTNALESDALEEAFLKSIKSIATRANRR